MEERLISICRVVIRGRAYKERLNPNSRIAVASRVKLQRFVADSRVETTGRVEIECSKAVGRVATSSGVRVESITPSGRVALAGGVREKGERSSGHVEAAGRVVQKRCRANGGVLGSLTRTLISDVEKERSRTHSGVVAPVSVASERKPAYCSVSQAGCEVEKSVLPLRRVEPRVAAVWGWDNRSHRRCDNKSDKHKGD